MAKIVRFGEEETVYKPAEPANDDLMALRRSLPMYCGRHAVVKAILSEQVTIVVGETGSGKSTQLPQALLDADPKQRIVVTQPRRVAAISLAQRVAKEAGKQPVGALVGYNVRFDAKLSAQTRIRYVTDGMLLREFMLNPSLSQYTTVIVDEAHERTLTSDLCLGLLKKVISKRKDLKIVVMSATLDAELFSNFFSSSTPLYVPGRAFKVERFYTREPVANIVDAAVRTVQQVNSGNPEGDILVFLPGQDEIESAHELLKEYTPPNNVPKLVIKPLYAALPEKQQQSVFEPVNGRKVVLATNIAETSVTIPGVRYVIDSGVRKVRIHRTKLGLESLLPGPISQASAAQRAGRAGRERDGKVWRLYTEDTYLNEMQSQTEPEIARVSLAHAVLVLKRVGVEDVQNFDWVTPPGQVAVRNALLQLLALNAIDLNMKITSFGRSMAKLPLNPELSAVLLTAYSQPSKRVKEAVLDVAACLSVPDLLITPSPSKRQQINDARHALFPAASQYGDLVLVKLVYDAYKRIDKSELKEWCLQVGVNFRGLQRVAQVRKQLLGYIQTSQKASKGNNKKDNSKNKDEDSEDSDDDSEEDSEEDSDNDNDEDKLSSDEYEALIKVFLQGYITNTAIALPDKRFQTTLTQQPVSIHPGSALYGQHPEAIMYLEYVYTVKGYARLVSPVEVAWLKETAPELLARASV